ncbi:unnamed protein product [Parnassius apollo]|uniref:(apollo) hypothetical protein n=1 Tax=Parnassius apollo TaxID=110799 RepID=A0A8S3X9D5_PARAO|nr:unnamed protein product [Parnassius apollo]
MGTLNLRLSYHDMRMFAAMLQSLPAQVRAALSGKSEEEIVADAPANSVHMRASAAGAARLLAARWVRSPAPAPASAPSPAPAQPSAVWPLNALQVDADCVTLCVIDDCLDSDVPLLEIAMSDLHLDQDLRKAEESYPDPVLVSTPSGGAGSGVASCAGSGAGGGLLRAQLSVDYYNRTLSAWEPALEPWRFETKWEYTLSASLSLRRLQVDVNSSETLDVNVTSAALELYRLVRSNWTTDYCAPQLGTQQVEAGGAAEASPKGSPAGQRRRAPFVPYALRNDTGQRLWFTTLPTTSDQLLELEWECGGAGSAECVVGGESVAGAGAAPDDSWVCVRAGDTEPFSFGQRRGRARSAPHRLALRLDAWTPPDPLRVDRVGVFFRTVTHQEADTNIMAILLQKSGAEARLVLEVSLEGSARKLVAVRSALQLLNRLPHAVEVRLGTRPYHSPHIRTHPSWWRCTRRCSCSTACRTPSRCACTAHRRQVPLPAHTHAPKLVAVHSALQLLNRLPHAVEVRLHSAPAPGTTPRTYARTQAGGGALGAAAAQPPAARRRGAPAQRTGVRYHSPHIRTHPSWWRCTRRCSCSTACRTPSRCACTAHRRQVPLPAHTHAPKLVAVHSALQLLNRLPHAVEVRLHSAPAPGTTPRTYARTQAGGGALGAAAAQPPAARCRGAPAQRTGVRYHSPHVRTHPSWWRCARRCSCSTACRTLSRCACTAHRRQVPLPAHTHAPKLVAVHSALQLLNRLPHAVEVRLHSAPAPGTTPRTYARTQAGGGALGAAAAQPPAARRRGAPAQRTGARYHSPHIRTHPSWWRCTRRCSCSTACRTPSRCACTAHRRQVPLPAHTHAPKLVAVHSALQLLNRLPHAVEVRLHSAPAPGTTPRTYARTQAGGGALGAAAAQPPAARRRGAPAQRTGARYHSPHVRPHPSWWRCTRRCSCSTACRTLSRCACTAHRRQVPLPALSWGSAGVAVGASGSRGEVVAAGGRWAAPLCARPGALAVRPLLPRATRPPAQPSALPPALPPALLHWRDASADRALLHRERRAPPDHVYRFCCVIVRERFPVERGEPLAGHTLTLVPALRLENLLPLELQYRAGDVCGTLAPADTRPFHEVNAEEGVELSVKLEGFGWSTSLSVGGMGAAAGGGAGSGASFSARLKLRDLRGRRLYLNARVSVNKADGIKVSVSAAYWLVNRTGLPLVFRAEGGGEAAGQWPEHELARMVAPLLFSFADADAGPTISARLGTGIAPNPEWCSPFGLGPGITVKRLEAGAGVAAGAERSFAVGVAVRAGRGRYHRTNIVTLTPRYQLHNNTSRHLQFAQKCTATTLSDPGASATHVSAVAGCHLPWHWARRERDQLLCVRVLPSAATGPANSDAATAWSGGFRIDKPRSLHIACRESGGSYVLLRAEVVTQGATLLVVLTDAACAPPPLRIDNHSPVAVMFHQVRAGVPVGTGGDVVFMCQIVPLF